MNHPVFGKMESLGQPFDDIAHKAASEGHTTADAPNRKAAGAPSASTSAAGVAEFVARLRSGVYESPINDTHGDEIPWPRPNLHIEAADMIEDLDRRCKRQDAIMTRMEMKIAVYSIERDAALAELAATKDDYMRLLRERQDWLNELAATKARADAMAELAQRNDQDARRYRLHCRNPQVAAWCGLDPNADDVLERLDEFIDAAIAKEQP